MKKPKLKSPKVLKTLAWKLCSEYVRRKYAGKDGIEKCYTCTTIAHWKEMQAGHMIGGRSLSILFCIEAIRPQCIRCNIFLKGNYGIFARNFIKENGIEEYDRLVVLSKTTKQIKRFECEELIKMFTKNLRMLND